MLGTNTSIVPNNRCLFTKLKAGAKHTTKSPLGALFTCWSWKTSPCWALSTVSWGKDLLIHRKWFIGDLPFPGKRRWKDRMLYQQILSKSHPHPCPRQTGDSSFGFVIISPTAQLPTCSKDHTLEDTYLHNSKLQRTKWQYKKLLWTCHGKTTYCGSFESLSLTLEHNPSSCLPWTS